MIVFQGGFHGRTYLTMAMTTSKIGYRAGYQPLAAGVFVAPFPDRSRTSTSDRGRRRRSPSFDQLLQAQTAPDETAAFVIEPVLGEGGYLPAPHGVRPRARRAICREHGILFVADEVQTGFGRTGRMFAVEHSGVEPDIMVMAKGIALGLPDLGDRRRRPS